MLGQKQISCKYKALNETKEYREVKQSYILINFLFIVGHLVITSDANHSYTSKNEQYTSQLHETNLLLIYKEKQKS